MVEAQEGRTNSIAESNPFNDLRRHLHRAGDARSGGGQTQDAVGGAEPREHTAPWESTSARGRAITDEMARLAGQREFLGAIFVAVINFVTPLALAEKRVSPDFILGSGGGLATGMGSAGESGGHDRAGADARGRSRRLERGGTPWAGNTLEDGSKPGDIAPNCADSGAKPGEAEAK